jgi:hypothetical protein
VEKPAGIRRPSLISLPKNPCWRDGLVLHGKPRLSRGWERIRADTVHDRQAANGITIPARRASFEVAQFECFGVSIDVLHDIFVIVIVIVLVLVLVLVLVIVIVIVNPHSITSTSTIRLRGLSTST